MKPKLGNGLLSSLLVLGLLLPVVSVLAEDEGGIFERAPRSSADKAIIITYDFPQPHIEDSRQVLPPKDSPRPTESYASVTMEGLLQWSEPGLPVLPFKTATILVPYGLDVESTTVVRGNRVAVPGSYAVEPGQKQVPLSYEGPLEVTLPDPDVYESSAPFPGNLSSGNTVQGKLGYRILLVNLHPVEYIPDRGELSYYIRLTIKVTLRAAADEGQWRRVRNLAQDEEAVRRMVDNPETIASYRAAPSSSEEPSRLAPDNHEYVIITNQALADTPGPYNFQGLMDEKISRGLTAILVTTEWIHDNYDGTRPDGGEDDQTRIRNFIIDAYNTWNTRYVLLGGDGDGADVGGESGDDIIPHRGFFGAVWPYYDEDIPADMYYACLDGTFDYNANGIYGEPNDGPGGGEVDLFAEVYVGRAAVGSEAEAQDFVRKTLAYQDTCMDYENLRKVWMVGERLNSHPLTWGGDYKDEIKEGSSAHGYTTVGFEDSTYADFLDVSTLYDRDYPGNSWPKGEIIDIINDNAHLINHLGHANVGYVMRMINSDVATLTNDELYFIGYSQGCYSGAFDNRTTNPDVYTRYDCIAEHLTNRTHGAVAFIANSRYGWYAPGSTAGPSQLFDRSFWDAVLGEGIFNIGIANQHAKEVNVGHIGSAVRRWCYYNINLFGDPELVVKLEPDSGIEGHVTDSDTGDPLEGTKVVVVETGQTRHTDASGHYRFYLVPDTYTITANAFGYDEQTEVVVVVEDEFTTQDFALEPLHSGFVAVSVDAPSEVAPGCHFVAAVTVDWVTDFDSCMFDVTYDETIITVTAVTGGEIDGQPLQVDWSYIPYGVGDTGTIRVIVGVPGMVPVGVDGTGYLAQIHLEVLGSAGDSSDISIEGLAMYDYQAQRIPTTTVDGSVHVAAAFEITTTGLPDGQVGHAYRGVLEASGGTEPYGWAIVGGALPDELELAAQTGIISGTPAENGVFDFTVRVTDAEQFTAQKEFSVTVPVTVSVDAPSEVAPGCHFVAAVTVDWVTDFDSCMFDVTYDETIITVTAVTGGEIDGHAVAVGSGDWSYIPPGVEDTGRIRVIATVPGFPRPGVSGKGYIAQVHFKVIGSACNTSDIALETVAMYDYQARPIPTTTLDGSVHVVAPLVVSGCGAVPNPTKVGHLTTFSVAVSGGVEPHTYEWNLGDGGTSTAQSPNHSYGAAGTYNVSVTVTDSLRNVQTCSFELVVNLPLEIATSELPDGEVGEEYSAALEAVGGVEPCTWDVTGLPNGLTCSEDGVISGTPMGTAGEFDVTITVTDALANSDSRSLILTVACKLGDANLDGVVDAGDLTKVKRILFEMDPPTPCGDVNGDGLVNAGDVTAIKIVIFGLM